MIDTISGEKMTDHEKRNVEFGGQILHPTMEFQFVDSDKIEKGQLILPIEIEGEDADQFSALHLIRNDFKFALNCLNEARNIGVPDDTHIASKALIFAGLVSYARPFVSGVRSFKLSPDALNDLWSEENLSIHNYLFELRQKHIAHSVNDCERCDTVGIIVTSPTYERQKGVSGVGITLLSSIGLTKSKMDEAVTHIETLVTHIDDNIDALRIKIHKKMKHHLDGGGTWTIAPITRLPNPQNVSERRRK